jgi:8-oxo-dGTP pyrophosphatase MutT (NUDIX family)
VREVREETGLVVRTGGILGMWIDTYGPDADKVTLNIYFHATAEGTTETRLDPNEVAEIAWFAPLELPSRIAFPGHIPAVLGTWRNTVGVDQPATLAPDRPTPAARGV